MAEGIGEIIGYLIGIKDWLSDIWEELSSAADIIVEGGTQVIGLSDAIAEPVEVSKNFLGVIFPGDVVIMFGVAFTVIIALAMRRSTK